MLKVNTIVKGDKLVEFLANLDKENLAIVVISDELREYLKGAPWSDSIAPITTLDEVDKELCRRVSLMRTHNATLYSRLPDDARPPRMLIILEGWTNKERNLLRVSRACGISYVLPTSDITEDMRSFFENIIT